ncbi:DNA cytosine methyltransferase [Phenylobacterium sp.]|uniref:DNA cytosine methyltransferase n=1 Tax=Phenylobacterium sp. TaxID=1871053 RepID=UPI002FCCB670
MKIAGLFAGVGGLEVGMARAGHEMLLASEILPAARAVLARRLPDVELVGDVRELARLPSDVDLVVAGFPCQDLSQAGLARGLDGDRSGLVEEVFRLAAEAKTPWIVLENVPFMLQLGRGAAMRSIVDRLEELGYLWAWRVVDSNGFELPHRRERVFLVASREGDPADVLMADDTPLVRPKTALGELAHGFYWTEGRGGLGWAVDAVPTLKNGSAVGIPSPPAILLPNGRVVKPDIRDAERLQGFPEDWTAPAEEVTRGSARWSLVGSAVSVPVAAWLGGRLRTPGAYDRSRDLAFDPVGRLPKAARFDGRDRHAVAIGVDPLGRRAPPLAEFLRHEGALLSPRATAGFLSRTRVAKLRFTPGFIDAVEAHYRHVAGVQIEPKRVA